MPIRVSHQLPGITSRKPERTGLETPTCSDFTPGLSVTPALKHLNYSIQTKARTGAG